MKFSFAEDQLLFRDSVREFLEKECAPELVCSLAQSESGRSPEMKMGGSWSGERLRFRCLTKELMPPS